MFLMLYMIIMTTSPAPTRKACSLTRSRRVVSPFSRRDVDENMQTIEIRQSMSRIIQTTLSPSKRSANVHRENFLVLVAMSACFYSLLTASLNCLPLSS